MSSPSSSSPVVPSLPPSPGSTAPGPDKPKKKKKEFVEFDPSAFPSPSPKAWGPGMNPPGPSPSAYKPQPLPSSVDARNADVATLIKHQPPGAVRVVGPYSLSEDTIVFPLTVTEAPSTPPGYQQPLQRVWNLEIHYHPVPTTKNHLHVKMRVGTSAENVLPDNNWLVDRINVPGRRDGLEQPEATDKQSAHKW